MMTMVTPRTLLTRMRVMTMKVTMTSDDDEDDNDGISHACDAGANNDIDNDYNSDHDTVGGHFDKTDGSFFSFQDGLRKVWHTGTPGPVEDHGAQTGHFLNKLLIAADHSGTAPATTNGRHI